ncbi:threonine synthase [Natrarchaeobius halalkaliphilus]|uniref:Threonine synthase n=1 Tax=Natrarchaeobius halalkaliphilus TaxID=1679091 RepID=A0A3N6P1C2_9EURY|nr:threonine synthase [Natrarchaeobius halalkaliphilus]RQG91289.1 threonine synthase [Natrarchaeobius halalkaliphilus]
METTDAFVGLECLDCGASHEVEEKRRCPDCGGPLDPSYDYDSISLERATIESRPFDSLWRYEEVLPFSRETAVTMDEGATALVECPSLADELGVERVMIKDEGRNPTGSVDDRGASVAVTAAVRRGASDVALASPGNGGQAVSAYAGRAGLESHVYLPSRSGFTNKAMVNVHGGDMNVVGGRFDDAVGAFEEGLSEHDDWHSLQAVSTPYRHEGAKTLLYEIAEALEWNVPDVLCCPTGQGTTLLGAYKGAMELQALGLVDELPSLYAAQAAGCAPIVDAVEAGRDEHDPVETPDTICGGIEIPDPIAGRRMLEAIRETDGGAVASDDQDVLEAGVQVATHEGVAMVPSAAVAASAVWNLAEGGEFDGDETVVIVNGATGNKEADVLRSYLMSQGI